MVVITPQLCAYKNLFPGNTALFDSLPDLGFDVVDPCRVNQAHPLLQGTADGLFLRLSVLECSESQSWDLGSGVECVRGCAGG